MIRIECSGTTVLYKITIMLNIDIDTNRIVQEHVQ